MKIKITKGCIIIILLSIVFTQDLKDVLSKDEFKDSPEFVEMINAMDGKDGKENLSNNLQEMKSLLEDLDLKADDKFISREKLVNLMNKLVDKSINPKKEDIDKEGEKLISLKKEGTTLSEKVKVIMKSELSKKVPDKLEVDKLFNFLDEAFIDEARNIAFNKITKNEEESLRKEFTYNDEYYEEEPNLSDIESDDESESNLKPEL